MPLNVPVPCVRVCVFDFDNVIKLECVCVCVSRESRTRVTCSGVRRACEFAHARARSHAHPALHHLWRYSVLAHARARSKKRVLKTKPLRRALSRLNKTFETLGTENTCVCVRVRAPQDTLRLAHKRVSCCGTRTRTRTASSALVGNAPTRSRIRAAESRYS